MCKEALSGGLDRMAEFDVRIRSGIRLFDRHAVHLYPGEEQEESFSRSCLATRFVHNWILSGWYRAIVEGRSLPVFEMKDVLGDLVELTWSHRELRPVHPVVLEQAARDVVAVLDFVRPSVRSVGDLPRVLRGGDHGCFRADRGTGAPVHERVLFGDGFIRLPGAGWVRCGELVRRQRFSPKRGWNAWGSRLVGRVCRAWVHDRGEGKWAAVLESSLCRGVVRQGWEIDDLYCILNPSECVPRVPGRLSRRRRPVVPWPV